ncbi:Arm DNA-binding domain-containing protein [Paraburkholderia sabiae]|uniref:Arm DNA-binding domain-containing protein n=1 Tax=Paraburkholderia sabiae TaxID=273251 RepID=A0ABU9Q8I5_9BURK|nr:Arm DNA-binding domain-containing protein [Paraburkholderia sabiae]WJZ77703.1 Arm DNA-binding domain-containing protein [Paraburkholderia sabiae]CAD6533070.1 hypothetical protein LMG24235_02703 [Paraburkholderia sabiae]
MAALVNTVRAIEALRAAPKVRYYKVASNLRLRVGTNGAKSFNVRFRVNGQNQEKTIGPYGRQTGQWTLHAALAEAAKVAAAARGNIDIIEAERHERIQREGATLAQVFEVWFNEAIAEKRGRRGRKDGGAILRRRARSHTDRAWDQAFAVAHAEHGTGNSRTQSRRASVASGWDAAFACARRARTDRT